MNTDDESDFFGPYRRHGENMSWESMLFLDELPVVERVKESYDFLYEYADIYNLYPASTPQPNPFSSRAMYIIDTLAKMGVKSTLDIFTFEGNDVNWNYNHTHKLVNIVAEPNPEATGPALVFVAHHDVMNVHSSNVQDNGASVCNLLRLAAMVKKSGLESKRVIILFSDSEESGARGAKRFVSKSIKKKGEDLITHDIYGQISGVINLELTGKGEVVWSDCEAKKSEIELHESLEEVLGKPIPKLNTPPSDAIPFRRNGYPVLCIGILPKDDMRDKQTWRLCHSLKDNITECNKKDMEEFTTFLFNLTKTKQ